MDASSGAVASFATLAYDNGNGIVQDADRNFYVAHRGANAISIITPAGSPSIYLSGRGLDGPNGLAFDPSWNLYVSNTGSQTIVVVAGGVVSCVLVSSGLNSNAGIAIDTISNFLYIADQGSNSLLRFATPSPTPSPSGTPSSSMSVSITPTALATVTPSATPLSAGCIYQHPLKELVPWNYAISSIAVSPYFGTIYVAFEDINTRRGWLATVDESTADINTIAIFDGGFYMEVRR
jgi:hypothetical protein